MGCPCFLQSHSSPLFFPIKSLCHLICNIILWQVCAKNAHDFNLTAKFP